ncbi:polysaccharide deacetylase family protein [Treponema sp. R80B11-R83G3]
MIIADFRLLNKNIVWGMYIILMVTSMSCSKSNIIKRPLSAAPEVPPLINAIQKIKRNSSEIKKYILFDKTGELVVKADIEEKDKKGNTFYFQVLYDMKRAKIDNSGEYLITFVLKDLETGEPYEDKLLWKPQKDDSGILLSFDDHYYKSWENYFGLFDRYNAKVTFFVTGTYKTNSYFSRAALKRGHDIGYHTLNHMRLPNITMQDFHIQTISQVGNFRNMEVPLVSFAYPYGLHRTWMHDELLKTYKVVRGYDICFHVYDRQTIREGFIFSRSIDNITFKYEDEFIAAIDIMFRTIKFTEQNLILPLTSHDITNKITWAIKPHRLEYILQTANELQLNFYRYSDFF